MPTNFNRLSRVLAALILKSGVPLVVAAPRELRAECPLPHYTRIVVCLLRHACPVLYRPNPVRAESMST